MNLNLHPFECDLDKIMCGGKADTFTGSGDYTRALTKKQTKKAPHFEIPRKFLVFFTHLMLSPFIFEHLPYPIPRESIEQALPLFI